MAAITAAVVATAATAYAANRQASAARNAQRSADRASAGQEAIQREQLEEGRRRYEDWQRRFGPALDMMGSQAMQAVRPDYEAIDADIAKQFDNSRAIAERNRFRYGYNPTDGQVAADERGYGISRALGMAGGRNAARTQARDESFNRLARYIDAGNGQRSAADGMQSAAYAGIASAFGQRASAGWGQSGMYQQMANNSWSDFGAGLGYLSTQFGNTPPGGG